MKIRWQDKILDTEVLSKANLPSVHTLLQKSQVRWAGHVIRMADERHKPEQLLYGELREGGRKPGGRRNDLRIREKLPRRTCAWI